MQFVPLENRAVRGHPRVTDSSQEPTLQQTNQMRALQGPGEVSGPPSQMPTHL